MKSPLETQGKRANLTTQSGEEIPLPSFNCWSFPIGQRGEKGTISKRRD